MINKWMISLLSLLLVTCSVLAQKLTPISSGELINHTYHCLSYNEEHEQAEWVFYQLKTANVKGSVVRTNDFRVDSLVSSGSANKNDYYKSGYDRGHLCPAADMKLNKQAMSETFYLSNMSPQKPYFNRGIWKKLEAKVREWALVERNLYVATGPIFRDNLGQIGENKITIPGYFYKVIYDPTGEQKMIAFILRNKKSNV